MMRYFREYKGTIIFEDAATHDYKACVGDQCFVKSTPREIMDAIDKFSKL